MQNDVLPVVANHTIIIAEHSGCIKPGLQVLFGGHDWILRNGALLPGLEGHHGKNFSAQQLVLWCWDLSAPAVLHQIIDCSVVIMQGWLSGLNHIVYGAVTVGR